MQIARYNPNAYVRGGAPANVARATQRSGRSVLAAPTKKRPAAPAGSATAAPPAAPSVQETAASIAEALLKPLIDQINASATTRSETGTRAITGYTQNAVDQLKQLDFGAPYQGAIQSQNAVNDALLQRLEGKGSELATSLAGKLAAAGQDTGGSVALQQTGTGAANAGYASGDATLSRLISEGASAGTYGRKLPGIQLLAGAQDVAGLQGAIAADTKTQLGQVAAQEPQFAYGIMSDLQDRQDAQAAAKSKAAQDAAELDFKRQQQSELTSYRDAQLILKQRGMITDAQYKQALLDFRDRQQTDLNSYRAGQLGLGQQRVDASQRKAAKAKISTKDLRDARSLVQRQSRGFYASQADPSKQLTQSQISSAAKAAGLSVGDFLADPEAMAAAGIGWTQIAPAADKEIQQLYLTLVKQYGIPARQAFQMVAGTYKEWGRQHADYFQGKAGAAAETAARLGRPQQAQLAKQALTMIGGAKLATAANIEALVGRIMQESGGNPRAINLWDSNAKKGIPSKGILQTIDPTFDSYKLPGHGDIWNPLDNALAAIRYMLARYGRIVGPSSTGY